MTHERIAGPATYVQAGDQVSCELDAEVVILNARSGIYYGLDAVGARIWELLQEPRTLTDIRGTLLAEYEIAADRCEREVLALLDRLAAEGLIRVSYEAGRQIP